MAVSLTDHVLPDVSHGVKFLLADLTGELLLRVAVDNLVVLVQRPQLLESLSTGHTLSKHTAKKRRCCDYWVY